MSSAKNLCLARPITADRCWVTRFSSIPRIPANRCGMCSGFCFERHQTDSPLYQYQRRRTWLSCFWWLEYGARLDTVHDTEEIKFELWKIVFGVWDYIKNSGKYPGVAGEPDARMGGTDSGKRESRRFEGLYMINQNDIISQAHSDVVRCAKSGIRGMGH